MLARSILFATVLVLCGCNESPVPPPAASEPRGDAATGSPWFAEHFARGRAVYDTHCASCHDPGTGDAPAVGKKEDWDDRSRLWTAVLFEHAKAGYLEMPAKGGTSGLTDKDVTAAAEYMLTVTYPELPVD
jgi:cytochrome c5